VHLSIWRQLGPPWQAILVAAATRDADCPDKLAVYDNWNTAINRNSACKTQQSKALSACGHTILKELCRTPKQGCRVRFLYCQVDASCLGVLHSFEIHEIAPCIDDSYRHLPIVFLRLRNRGSGEFFAVSVLTGTPYGVCGGGA
jgi:hypothetical protein